MAHWYLYLFLVFSLTPSNHHPSICFTAQPRVPASLGLALSTWRNSFGSPTKLPPFGQVFPLSSPGLDKVFCIFWPCHSVIPASRCSIWSLHLFPSDSPSSISPSLLVCCTLLNFWPAQPSAWCLSSGVLHFSRSDAQFFIWVPYSLLQEQYSWTQSIPCHS